MTEQQWQQNVNHCYIEGDFSFVCLFIISRAFVCSKILPFPYHFLLMEADFNVHNRIIFGSRMINEARAQGL